MEIVIGMIFEKGEWAKSGAGLVALSPECPEEKVEEVLSHEAVHLAIEKMFGNLSLGELLHIQKGWDLADIGVHYDVINKKVVTKR